MTTYMTHRVEPLVRGIPCTIDIRLPDDLTVVEAIKLGRELTEFLHTLQNTLATSDASD